MYYPQRNLAQLPRKDFFARAPAGRWHEKEVLEPPWAEESLVEGGGCVCRAGEHERTAAIAT